VTIVLQKDRDANWGAVENVIKAGSVDAQSMPMSRSESSDETELEEL